MSVRVMAGMAATRPIVAESAMEAPRTDQAKAVPMLNYRTSMDMAEAQRINPPAGKSPRYPQRKPGFRLVRQNLISARFGFEPGAE